MITWWFPIGTIAQTAETPPQVLRDLNRRPGRTKTTFNENLYFRLSQSQRIVVIILLHTHLIYCHTLECHKNNLGDIPR